MKSNHFSGSLEKFQVTEFFDLPIIQSFFKGRRNLRYLGMPGPRAQDVDMWKHNISSVTAMEYPGRCIDLYYEIERNIQSLGIKTVDVLRGSFEALVTSRSSCAHLTGNRMTELRSALARSEIINLDFFGGLGYQRKGRTPSRLKAIKTLIGSMEGRKFLLFLTVNVRDTLKLEMQHFLLHSKKSLCPRGVHLIQSHLNYIGSQKHLLIKAVLPLFVKNVSEYHCFNVFAHPPVNYSGNRSSMVHFAFEFLPQTVFGVYGESKQSVTELLELPLIQVDEGQFLIYDRKQATTLCHDFVGKLVKRAPYLVSWRRDERQDDDRVDGCELEPGHGVYPDRAGM